MTSSRFGCSLLAFVFVLVVGVSGYELDEDYDDEDRVDLLQMLLDHMILHQMKHTELQIVKTVKIPKRCYQFCAKKKTAKKDYALDCDTEAAKLKGKKKEKLRLYCLQCRVKCTKAKFVIYM